MSHTPPPPDILERLCAIVGPQGAIRERGEMDKYLREWRNRWQGETELVVRPKNAEEVAEIVRVCAKSGTPIILQGGNTGLVGGQIPHRGQILLSLERMKAIRAIEALDNSLVAEAGCVLKTVQDAAVSEDRLFPLSLASEGSAQIGGLIATNAGGVHAVRYGTMGDLVLGLEVVTAQGAIWNDLKSVRKDNTGYRLCELFVGSEGTLGIITAASLRLSPLPRDVRTVFLAVPDVSAAVALLSLAQDLSGGAVSAFELVPRRGVDFVLKHVKEGRDPLETAYPWYVLAEFWASTDPGRLNAAVEKLVMTGTENSLIENGVVAESTSQAKGLWLLRDRLSEVQRLEGASLKHDVAVPIAALPSFVDQALAAVTRAIPGVRPVPFGHLGDGNLHFNLSQPCDMDADLFLSKRDEIARIVHDLVHAFGGSFSAEHGIGVARLDDMARYKSPVELDLMRRLKQALDPQGILNPGRTIPDVHRDP